MKTISRRSLAWLSSMLLLITSFCSWIVPVQAATVDYVYSGSYIYNWGTRDEVATFLSPNAIAFYEDNDVTYKQLAALNGSSSTSSVPSSALYLKLQDLMESNHTYKTSYEATKDLYQYTDCQGSGKTSNRISSFYSGTPIGPSWDGGATWNREHTWPNSKGLGGSDENDIMMLRPTSISENSSRSNTAYGEGSNYYDPNQNGQSLHGDVARIMLYQYVRWGNTGYMWGSSGVMESKAILLTWMEEDPVDTWELGRNDSVESITGTRNVFVDYPELAFELFEADIPENYQSPSGGTSGGTDPDPDAPVDPDVPDTPVGNGTATITFDDTDKRTTFTTSQQVWQENGITVTNNKSSSTSDVADYVKPARFYKNSELIVAHPGMTKIEFTCNNTEYANNLMNAISDATANGKVVTVVLDGVDSFRCVLSDGQVRMDSITVTYSIEEPPAACDHQYDNACDADCNLCGAPRTITHDYESIVTSSATCGESGERTYTCSVCGDSYTEAIPATGAHTYSADCDADCNVCGAPRTAADHTYTADCDTYCDVCGAERTVTAGGTATITFDNKTKRTTFTTSQQVWQENGITVTNNKTSSSDNVADYVKPARFYASSELIVAHPGMTKIVFTCNSSGYATALKKSITTGTATASDSTVTVTFDSPVDALTISSLSGGQVRVDSITVTAAGAKHVYDDEYDPDCNVCGSIRLIETVRLYSDTVLNSAMEMDDGLSGLAFKFELPASGVTKNEAHVGDLTNATVDYQGVTCRVIGMGAVVSNDATVGKEASAMVRDHVNSEKTVIDIPAQLLYQCEANFCCFAVRITNIPEEHQSTTIYARPYCVIEYKGQELVVYDEIASASYAEFQQIDTNA